MQLRKFSIIILGLLISLNSNSQKLTVDEKVDSVLNLMTLDEKIGQMTQVERSALEDINHIASFGIGSLLSGGGSAPDPNNVQSWADMYDNYQSVALQSNVQIPLIYGIDAVHGHNNVYGAVLFPHNIGMGCTWDTILVEKANQITAKEVAATGIDWTFAPCIAVVRNEKWGRTYEGFGETAEIQKIMAKHSVVGLQGDDLGHPETILACAKHFVGDGGTTDGIDQGNTEISEYYLREIHMQGYIDAIEAGVGSIMASYNSWNGEKLHGHDYLLNDILKNELGFEGFVVSDWKGVDQIDEDYRTAIKRAINAGIDMVMVPDRYEVFIGHLKDLVLNNEVSESRIDDAVKRILKQKFLLDLFEKPYTDQSLISSVGSQEHRDVAREAVRKSMVMLSAKDDVLPLKKNNQKILVAGSLAADLGAQCGGWSIYWQGGNGNITTGTNILQGLQNLSENSEIIYSEAGDYAGDVDVAVVVVGEKNPYAEGAGDRESLNLSLSDISLVKRVKNKGIPVIALLVSGRPMIIGDILPYTDAVFASWLPGTEGEGIAEVLFGDYNPSGKLTHSWPKNMDQVPINVGDYYYLPLYEYKHGLQYFPANDSSEFLLPYSAATNNEGDQIILALTDSITDLNYSNSDFSLFINSQNTSDIINNINISEFDKSVLIIDLNGNIESTDEVLLSYDGNEILSNALVLSGIQSYFVYNAVGNSGTKHMVPGKIEAEDYYDMYGIQTESCSDEGGGLNVGYIDSGDWMEYNVEVSQTGRYLISARIAGYNGGSLKFQFNDSVYTYVDYNSTDGWQNWEDFVSIIYLEAGIYNMKVLAQNNAFNINYFNFSLHTAIEEPSVSIEDVKVYPNPFSAELKLTFNNDKSRRASIKLIDITGKITKVLYQGNIDSGLNNFNFTIDANLPMGIYFVEIKDESQRYFKKVIKK